MGTTLETQNDKYKPLFEQGLSTGNGAADIADTVAAWSESKVAADRAAGVGVMEVGGRNQVRFRLFGNAAADVDIYGEKQVEGGGYLTDWLGTITPTLGAGVAPSAMPGCGVADATWVDQSTVVANGNGAIGVDGVEVRPASGGADIAQVFRADAMGYERIVVRVPVGMNAQWYGY